MAIESYHLKMYERLRKDLEGLARKATRFAFSYRGFQVGAAVLAWDGGKYEIFSGSNIKPEEDGPKVCAEQIAIGAARSKGYNLIIALVVAGDPQVDSESGVFPKTLHPCWICRKFLGTLPEVRPDTIVLTLDNHRGPCEEHTVEELLKKHGTCAPSA